MHKFLGKQKIINPLGQKPAFGWFLSCVGINVQYSAPFYISGARSYLTEILPLVKPGPILQFLAVLRLSSLHTRHLFLVSMLISEILNQKTCQNIKILWKIPLRLLCYKVQKWSYHNSDFSCFRQSLEYGMKLLKSYLSCLISWSCSSCHLYLCIMLHCLSKCNNKIFIPKQICTN